MSKNLIRAHCRDCILRAPLFYLLTENELDIINAHRHEVMYNPGEIISKQGSPSGHVLSFVTGLAKAHIESNYHKDDLILRLIKPVELLAGPELYNGKSHHYSITAITHSHVCFIEQEAFKSVLRSNTAFSEAFLKMNQKRLVESLGKLSGFYQKHQVGRLAEAILYLQKDIFNENPFNPSISKAELAALAGISVGSTYKILKQFNDDGLVRVNGMEMEVLDFEMLQQVSDRG